ncbi:peptidoglycan DD-metalloendopeptidase family protein [Pseudodesulfovibrio cashew]|uniref:Peptidoglycan DD-metalloendopeptidase family protein n=1 Tax=Pseudodesulfovibrio cashew TaxID=2678688 RepID=A0A6I6JJB7_9BACT|nr:peptidoglycan DD-metalloendopeptidase family protein [Pseudodesulfovibrio cashew]QGY41170.1 peptidoglycan DD-metalloendopeptidase family protein [Pseudodesulfovibrio cashew]
MKQFLLLLALLLTVLPGSARAEEDGEALQQSLQQEHQRADDKEMKVRELTKQAGRISTKLSDIEHDIRVLKSKVGQQEKVLKGIRDNERKARQEHFALEKEKQLISGELADLVRTLWPVHLQNIRARFEGVDSWDEFDRRFNWLTDIYGATREKLEEARVNSERIARNLERQRLLEAEAENQLAMVNKNKDRLLGSQYSLRKKLNKVRKERSDAETELSEILASIEDLRYQLQSQKTKRFSLYKRTLPWPVNGHLVSGFRPKAKPPVRGLILSAPEGTGVQSVFWGKVVHNDTLRGFGHVVIVYHGYNYYSLYAYLSETYVRNGQEVEKNEPLGVVGYNPKAGGPGLYFELRFHQKPINPKLWLTARR